MVHMLLLSDLFLTGPMMSQLAKETDMKNCWSQASPGDGLV